LFGALIALVFMGGLAAAAFAKAYGIGFLGEPRSEAAGNAVEPGRLNRACLLIPALCCVGFAAAAPWIFSFLMSPAALSLFPAGLDKAAGAQAVVEAAEVLEQSLLLGAGASGLALAFWPARRFLLRRGNGAREARTWDCGCQLGTPRIQYSPASFVEPLTRLFALVVGLSRSHEQRDEFFPSRMTCEVRLSGGLLRDVFAPFFEGARRVCDCLKLMQHGHMRIYILYILVTLAGLLLWGLSV
jgi:hydrogenase-4 component B